MNHVYIVSLFYFWFMCITWILMYKRIDSLIMKGMVIFNDYEMLNYWITCYWIKSLPQVSSIMKNIKLKRDCNVKPWYSYIYDISMIDVKWVLFLLSILIPRNGFFRSISTLATMIWLLPMWACYMISCTSNYNLRES